VGRVVPPGRDDAAARRLSAQVPQHPADTARQAPRPARQTDRELPHEDAAAVRVRETPARAGVGRDVSRRPNQRHPAAAHLVSAEPPLSALLRPDARPVPRQVVVVDGCRRQTGVAHSSRTPHQLAQSRKTLTAPRPCGQRRAWRRKNWTIASVSQSR